MFHNTSKWLFLKSCLTKLFLSTKSDSYGFFSHLDRFKIFPFFTYHRFLPFIAGYLRLGFSVTMKFRNPVLQSLIGRTIWRPLSSHKTWLLQVSFIFDFIWAPFLSYFLKTIFAAFVKAKLFQVSKCTFHISLGFSFQAYC